MVEWVLIAMVYGYGNSWMPVTSEHFKTKESCIQFGEDLRKEWITTKYLCLMRKP